MNDDDIVPEGTLVRIIKAHIDGINFKGFEEGIVVVESGNRYLIDFKNFNHDLLHGGNGFCAKNTLKTRTGYYIHGPYFNPVKRNKEYFEKILKL